jgi:hypothetical protein
MLRQRSAGLKQRPAAHESRVQDPGLARHEWESEMASLEEDLETSPMEALPELDALVARMLDEAGYELHDPVARAGEEREVVAEYAAAHEIAEALERDAENISPGDVASAINGLRAIFDYLVAERGAADANFPVHEE